MNIPAKQFLDSLVKDAAINQTDAASAEIAFLRQDDPIDLFLLKSGNVKKEAILKAKAAILNIEWTDVNATPISPEALNAIPEAVSRKYSLIPYELDDKDEAIKVVMDNPFDFQTIEFLQKKTGKKIIPTLGLKDDIDAAIEMFYTKGLSPEVVAALKEVTPEVKTIKAEDIGNIIKEAPIAKIVSTVLEYAVKGRASDIHIEPQENRTRIRYRIDGMLQEKLSLPKGIHDSLVSRIKIISELKIDERRIPQDGRFNFKIGAEEVDLRVSTLPTVHGEKVVIRLLKKTGGIPTLAELGLGGTQLKILERTMLKPFGIILVTGPTGSGKSTTLYSVLSNLNKPSVNIVTLEDPVEYQILGINQVQVNVQAGLTFATGLRAFLRQDPNIILVGEIRDKETTELAIQAALTGHLVFATLHTNDAATAIPRLIDLGGEPFLIASVLNAAVAQRICRRICTFCKKEYDPDPAVIKNIREVLANLMPSRYSDPASPVKLYKGAGCPECSDSGYLGRVAIFEVIEMTPPINKMIMQATPAKLIEEEAMKEGLINMKQDGYLKALDGVTTIEEVLRVAEV